MECPVCGNGLTEMTVGGTTVDACARIWFDRYELMCVDESHESAGEELLSTERDPNPSVDRTKRLR